MICGYLIRLGIVMRVFLVELSVIHIELLDNIHNADNSRRLGVGVVEESLLADLHGFHVVPGRVVPHPVPAGGGFWLSSEVVNTELHVDSVLKPALRLRFHQPVGELWSLVFLSLFGRTRSRILRLLSLSLTDSARHTETERYLIMIKHFISK